MRRRSVITSLGLLSAFSGCIGDNGPDDEGGQDDNGQPGGVNDTEDQPSDGEDTDQPNDEDNHEIHTAESRATSPNEIQLEIVDFELSERITYDGDAEDVVDGDEMLVLLKLRAENQADSTRAFPHPDDIALITDGRQYDTYFDSNPAFGDRSDISIDEPVQGTPFEIEEHARPEVSQEGWFVFKTDRDVSTIQFSWWSEPYDEENESFEVTFEVDVNPDILPNVQIAEINVPAEAEAGELGVQVVVENNGGSTGEGSVEVTIDPPEVRPMTYEWNGEIDSGSQKTIEFEPRVVELGEYAITINGISFTSEVTPRYASFGEEVRMQGVESITVRKPIATAAWENVNGREGEVESGHTFLFFLIEYGAPEEDQGYRPDRRDFLLQIDNETYEAESIVWVDSELVDPVDAKAVTSYNRTIDAGRSEERYIFFEIPEDAAYKSQAVLEARWSFGVGRGDTKAIWD